MGQKAQQFMEVNGSLVPCTKYPNCSKCPPKLSMDKKGKDYTCKACGAKRMTLWEVPTEKLKAPDVAVQDFKNVLKHAFSSVSPEELEHILNGQSNLVKKEHRHDPLRADCKAVDTIRINMKILN